MDAELRHHLELETAALIAARMTPAAARETARRRFGSVALVQDDCRESWGMRAIDALSGSPLRGAQPAQVPVLHRGRRARPRHRRQHRDLQRRPRSAAAAAALRPRRPPDRSPPAGGHEADSRQPVSRIRTLEAIRSHSLAPPRLTAMLVTLFAAVALIITAAGIDPMRALRAD